MEYNTPHNEYDLDLFPLVSTGSGFSLYMSPRHKEYYEDNRFEPFTVRLVSNFLSRYSLFIDVGANYGFFSLLACTARPEMDVIALEPTPETFQALERSIANAQLGNIELHQVAAGDKDGTASFNVSIYAGNCSFYSHPAGETLRQVEVRTVKLDTLLADRKPCPTLVKVNVEGHELAVLAGMKETFARFPDLSLILELNPSCLRAAGHEPEEMLRTLDELGYAVFLLDEENGRHYRLRRDNDWEKLIGKEGYSNLYCVRKEAALSACFFGPISGLAGAERSLVSTVSQLIRDHGALCTVIFPERGPAVDALEAAGAVCLESPGAWWGKVSWAELEPGDAQLFKPGISTLLGSTLPLLSDVNPDIVAFADRLASPIDNPQLAADRGNEGHAHALKSSTAKLAEAQAELSATLTQRDKLQAELSSAKKAIDKLEQVVLSAQQWQKSWFKRIFHRWRPPGKLKRQQKPSTAVRKVSFSPQEEAEISLIEQSGLFDKNWYLAQYGQQIGNQENLILHYLRHGVALGFNPGPHFSTQGYLDLYTDIAAAQLNPLLHYISDGRKEHRKPNVMSIKDVADMILAQFALYSSRLSPSKKTVLLVTHEMTRTGAPILVLNIARSMRRNFNIVVLSLKPGELEEEFTGACDVLISSENACEYAYSERLYSCVFQSLSAEYAIQFALANSIGSSAVIKPLWENNVPVIHLIHEFASYIRPPVIFLNSAVYSSLQVYPAALVRDNAILNAPEIRDARSIILPQGRNSAPGKNNSPKLAEEERQRIRAAFRPAGFPEETVVIVGLGTVEIRKGMDLFVMCAREVAALHPQTPFRFVWIGHGYNPEQDLFSMFIADQIQRSGLKDAFVIMDAVAEIEEAYRQADILFLSSRLDSLPLVSQDAMAHGKPVVCFENATGIAEYLLQDSDAAFGVVPYLDIGQAAHRICKLIDDGTYRKQVGEGCRRLVDTVFDFERYVRRLEELGLAEDGEKVKEKSDQTLIQRSGLIDPEFYHPPANVSQAGGDEPALKYYMSTWRSGVNRRKPFPGFHPAIYAECNNVRGRDPLAHYIEAGQPDGPWRFPIVGKGSPLPEGKTPKVGLHFHLYFQDLAGKIFERIQSVRTPMDLLISVPSKEVKELALSLGSQYARGSVEVRVVPNRGRDMGPFLTEFGQEILSKFDIIGHVHTKKSVDLQDRDFVKKWAESLYENLLGGQEPMADNIIGHMIADEKIGLVFPDDPFVIGWGNNREYARALAERLNIAHLLPPTALNFPVGTMFWARTAAIRPLLDLGLTWDDYPPEPLPYDGSILHAIERILPYVAESAGFTSAVTYVSGCKR